MINIYIFVYFIIIRLKNDKLLSFIEFFLYRYGIGCFLLMNIGIEVCGKVILLIRILFLV